MVIMAINPFFSQAQELFDDTRRMRRDFHRHPELGFKEIRTAGIVAKELNSLGLEVTTGIAETGVVALLEGQGEGPVVLLRFDMDALPIQEETGAEYASQIPGVMHACGHDGHTAIGLSVARILQAHRDKLNGKVKFVFQPAEEGLGGAQKMVAAGVLNQPKPDVALAMHVWNDKPFGWIGISPGPIMAAADTFRVEITGKGGHGASPHQTIDPVITASQMILALQQIVARNVNPLESAVVSVTAIRAGEAFNVIPASAELKGTIRTFQPEVRRLVHERVRQITTNIAQAFDCRAEIEIKMITPAVINNDEVARNLQDLTRRIAPDLDLNSGFRTMGSEDMAYLMEDIPGCYLFVGSANPAEGLDAGHHNPKFDFDENAMLYSVAIMAAAAASYLES
jgi:amidohydrolase